MKPRRQGHWLLRWQFSFYIRAQVPGDEPYDHEAVGARLGFWIAVLPLVVGTLLALVLMWLPASEQTVSDTESTAPFTLGPVPSASPRPTTEPGARADPISRLP